MLELTAHVTGFEDANSTVLSRNTIKWRGFESQQKPSSLRTRHLLTLTFPLISQKVSSLEIAGSKNSKLVGN